MITADEGDHFVGSAPTPAGCNGVKVACHYKQIGEVNGNLTGLLAAKGINTPFDVEADSAPAIYVHGQPGRATARSGPWSGPRHGCAARPGHRQDRSR